MKPFIRFRDGMWWVHYGRSLRDQRRANFVLMEFALKFALDPIIQGFRKDR